MSLLEHELLSLGEFAEDDGDKPAVRRKGYVWVVPLRRHANLVSAWLRRTGMRNPMSPHKMHLTLMYDKSNKVTQTQPKGDARTVYESELVEPAMFGRDSRSRTLVVTLRSPSLSRRHEKLKKTYGFTHSFKEFRPHLSIKQNADLMDLAKARDGIDDLRSALPTIYFRRERWAPTRD